ncbi:MAG: hypothetical protein IJ086_00395 [Clostridium sp.]|nr:hypothetical protein [Clostridium sp.]
MSLKKKVIKAPLKNINTENGLLIDIEMINKTKKMLAGQSKDKKTFLKAIFKVYEANFEHFDENTFDNLTALLDCREIEKIVLALRYKQGLNYKEKVNIINELTKDFTVEYFFTLDTIMRTYWNDLANAKFKVSNLTNLYKTYRYDDDSVDLLFQQLAILINTMALIRCVKYSYHNSNIVSVEKDYKLKKAITYNKMTACMGPILLVGDIDKADNEDIYDCVRHLGKVPNFDLAMTYILNFISHISTDEIVEDLYSKVVLRDEYASTVSNRITSTKDILYAEFNIKDFLRRKVLLPKSGVILLIKDNPVIESILLKEKLGTYYNNLIIVTRYKDGRENINTLIIKEWDLSRDERNLNVYKDEINYGGLTTADYVSSFFELYEENHYKYKPEYEIIAPYYWKYRNKNYVSENDKIDNKGVIIRREYSIDVAPFVRKINGEAGIESQALAKKLGIILDPGYTIVNAHTRTYNKNS